MARRFEPFRDEEFVRSLNPRVPMTNFETRAVLMSKLAVCPGDLVVDVGAGTGSLSMEAARLAYEGQVIAIDSDQKAVDLVRENAKKLGMENVSALHGKFSEVAGDLETVRANKIIIGGSKGELDTIIDWAGRHCLPDGRVCASFITLENAVKALEALRRGFGDVEVTQVQIAKGKRTKNGSTMMLSNNPVYILSAQKVDGI